jgi:non-ribosomal peptide synthetase component F
VPFERVVGELAPGRELNRNPLFQVMLSVQNAPREALELPGLTLAPQEFDSGSTRFDLECHLREYRGVLSGVFVYSTDLFEEATARRLLRHFETLLAGVAADPDAPLARLPLLSEDEARHTLVGLNETASPLPHGLCVHQLFERQAERTPDNTALVYGAERLSYRELNGRANRLARRLQKMGVGPDGVVGVSVERSPEMLVSVLAVLKAGGAYLPLDPEYPQERLAFMLEDAGVSVLLTQQHLLDKYPARGLQVIALDRDRHTFDGESDENPTGTVSRENLAYVIYTSGSTGRPKGVAMPHRPLVNLLTWQVGRSSLVAEPRTLQFASLSFDVSFQETFST